MKTFIEFRHLERFASQSPAKFLEVIETQLNEGGAHLAVEALRLSGICVDIYGTGKHNQLLKDSIELITTHAGDRSQYSCYKTSNPCFLTCRRDVFRSAKSV